MTGETPPAAKGVTEAKLRWLIDFWKTSAERSESLARTVSGAGEEAEIYRNTEKALRALAALSLPALGEGEAPVAWQWLHYDPVSGEPVWHNEQFRNGHTSTFSRALYTAIQPGSYGAMWERQARTIGELQNEIERLKRGPTLNDRAAILTENFDQDHNITVEEAADFRSTPSSGGLAVKAAVEAMRVDPFIDDATMLGTTQQDMRMQHYAEIAVAALSSLDRTTLPAAEGEKT